MAENRSVTRITAAERACLPGRLAGDIYSLRRRYPNLITRVETFGRSAWGAPLWAVCVGEPDAKRALLIDAGIHAREYMGTLLCMKLMERVVQSADDLYNGWLVADMLQNCCIWFLPALNPDGARLSQLGLAGLSSPQRAELLRLNAGSADFARWKANARGVDLNRNFDACWTEEGEPSPAFYHGPSPCSEPETRALTRFVLDHPNISASVNYHSVGNTIFWHFHQTGSA